MGTILDLRRGQRARIAAIETHGDAGAARRLCELGFDDGVEVELLHKGPIGGDPLAVRVGSMTVALRRALAGRIAIEPFAEAAE